MPKLTLSFTSMGATVEPEPGTLFLDTGNRLTPGVVDHHHMSLETCTARLVLDRPELSTGWIGGGDAVVVVHHRPDLDCIASFFIVDAILNGGPPRDVLERLADYALEVDLGRFGSPNVDNPGLYEILTARLHLVESAARKETGGAAPPDLDSRLAEAGIEVVGLFARTAADGVISGFDSFPAGDGDVFAEERRFLAEDYRRYTADLGDFDRVSFLTVRVPEQAVALSREKTALVYRNPRAALFKLWARHDTVHAPGGDGFRVLLVIWDDGGSKRYVMSTEPTGDVSLRFLGDVLNVHEKRARAIQGTTQEGPVREGYDLPDPWYDGRGHAWTIVDTPRNGTVLSEESVLSIFAHFVTENILFNAAVAGNRLHVTLPVRLPEGWSPEKARKAGFGETGGDTGGRRFFLSSFSALFFGGAQRITHARREDGGPGRVTAGEGALEETFDFTVEAESVVSYGDIMLYTVELSLRCDRIFPLQTFMRHVRGMDLSDPAVRGSDLFRALFGGVDDAAPGWTPAADGLFTYSAVLTDDFQEFRELWAADRLIDAFLAGEPSSIPSRPHAVEIVPFTEVCRMGMNGSGCLSFQNLRDSRLDRASVRDIFEFDQRRYEIIFRFVVLRKVLLDDFSDRFSRIDLLGTDRATRRKIRALVTDTLDYINTVNTRRLTDDRNGIRVFETLLAVHAIDRSFDEIHTSLGQLVSFSEQRLQKQQNRQMDLLQAIFLVGVTAAVIGLGAMPGAWIETRDAAGKLIGRSEMTSFDPGQLLVHGPLVILSAFAVYLIIKYAFARFGDD